MGFFKSIGKAISGAVKSVGKAVSSVGKVAIPSILGVAKFGSFIPGVGTVAGGIASTVSGLASRASDLSRAIQAEVASGGGANSGGAVESYADRRVGSAVRKVVIWR